MTVRSILTACAIDLLETEENVTVDQVVGCAWKNHADEFAAERDRLVWDAARRVCKDVLRALSEDDDADGPQLQLPGLTLPSTIAVPTDSGDFVYVRSDKATWAQLLAGRMVRERHVQAATRKLDLYDEALAMLRPLMEGDETCTVREAWQHRDVA